MSCERWQEAMAGRVYAENEPAEDRALESHLESCGACRAALDDLRRVRVLLRENEPEVERILEYARQHLRQSLIESGCTFIIKGSRRESSAGAKGRKTNG